MKQTNKTNCRAVRRGVAALLLLTVSVAANAYDFEAVNDDGVTIYYNILSDSEASVTWGGNSSSSALYSGVVVIPETVTYNDTTYTITAIGDYAFFNCTGLTEVTIPDSVTEIGSNAFEGCSRLTSVTIPNSVTTIGSDAFRQCRGLTEVTIPNSVTEIGSNAFSSCSRLTSVTIPNSVETIGDGAFSSCSRLTSVTIPNSVTEIGRSAFSECTGLTSVTIPNSVTEIGDYSFAYCSGLTEVTIGNSVTTIGSSAFYKCTGLTSVTIPDSVTKIGSDAFGCCTGLKEFEVAEGSEYFCAVDGVLYSKDMTRLVAFPPASPLSPSFDIPNSVTTIGSSAFRNCSGLTSVTIGSGVKTIDGYAFMDCTGLTSVTIGNSVTTIDYYAFDGCTGLTSIYSLNPEPPKCNTSNVFYRVDTEACVLYVPEGSKEAYSTAYVWKDFLNIVDNQPNAIEDIMTNGSAEPVGYYTLDGKKLSHPQRGVNIIRYSDGTARKVMAK